MDVYSEVWRQVHKRFPIIFTFSINVATSAVMLMETFDRLSRKEKYVWDVRT